MHEVRQKFFICFTVPREPNKFENLCLRESKKG
jgi:hypothetical protein